MIMCLYVGISSRILMLQPVRAVIIKCPLSRLKFRGTNFISSPIFSSSVHLTGHVHIHDCLSCHLAANALARLSEHFIILFSVSICSSAPFVSLLCCFHLLLSFLYAGRAPGFCSASLSLSLSSNSALSPPSLQLSLSFPSPCPPIW